MSTVAHPQQNGQELEDEEVREGIPSDPVDRSKIVDEGDEEQGYHGGEQPLESRLARVWEEEIYVDQY